MVAIEQVVPFKTHAANKKGHHAHGRCKHEEPQDAGHHWGYSVGPNEQCFVDASAAHQAVGHDCQQQRHRQTCASNQDGKEGGGFERVEVAVVAEQSIKVFHADILHRAPKCVLGEHTLVEGLTRGPKEKNQHNHHLRCDEHPRQPS